MQDNPVMMTMKRKQTYLSNKEKWDVAKWLIENKCVVQDVHAYKEAAPAFIPFTLWRVKKITAITEINDAFGAGLITQHHLDQSIAFYNEICELTGNHPNVPPIQDTVEMDMLTAQVKRLENDIKEIAGKYEIAVKHNKEMQTNYTQLEIAVQAFVSKLPANMLIQKRVPVAR